MESFLDQDFYIFSIGQAVFEHYPRAVAHYDFIDRNHTRVDPTLLPHLREETEKLDGMRPTFEEIEFLSESNLFTKEYLKFLEDFCFNSSQVSVNIVDEQLYLSVEGPWVETIFWEVPLLALTTELYLKDAPLDYERHKNKIVEFKLSLPFCEFGTRRRRNFKYQDIAIETLKTHKNFLGTSNVHLAKKYGAKFIGTIAHQFYSGMGALHGIQNANIVAMQHWLDTYRGKLGTVLIDTFTTDFFLKDFDWQLSRLFDGVRQDSGDPLEFTRKIIEHYRRLGIDPKTKTIYYSDGLTPEKCREIESEIGDEINKVFCIGTYFTNDNKLNIVMKLTKLNDEPCVKLSDEPGKAVGNPFIVNETRKTIERILYHGR